MKKSLTIGSVVFIAWVIMWAVVRPFVDYFVHGQYMNIGRDLISGAISGVIFTALLLLVLHVLTKNKR